MVDFGEPVAGLRLWLGGQVRELIAGERKPQRWPEAGEPGLFEPDSVIRRVHASSAMLVGGLRAILLQTLHPQAMAAVAQHSNYRTDPWGRLHRTGDFVASTTFGSRSRAEAAIRHVRRVHEGVVGVDPDGRPYRANDPHLLAWVHATEVDSFLRAYRRYGATTLSAAEQDRYVAEMAELAHRLGVEAPPTDTAELRAFLQGIRCELRGSSAAREAARFVLFPPAPIAARGAYGVLGAAAVGLLPPFARRELRLALPPGFDVLAGQPSARVVLRALTWLLTAPVQHSAAAAASSVS